jgi:hypothetical protein
MSCLRSDLAILVAFTISLSTAKGDMSSLGVTGPHSGSGFSNLGAVTKEAVATTLTKADVLIELQKRDGDNLTATCRAVFDLDTDPDVPKTGQTVLVAFPVTGLGSDAVDVSQFEVVVDGVRKPELQRRFLRLFSGENSPYPFKDIPAVEANPDTFQFFGYKLYGRARAIDTGLQAYVWSQEFFPGKRCRVQVKYILTLHAQSLAYAKKVLHEHSLNVVPFDAMWAGESGRKAFFLDYILRSGGTWKGPIGHETITLTAAATSGLVFEDEEVVTFGRHVFAYDDDLRESVGRYKAGLGAPGVVHSNGIVWEIDHEKPEQDILVEILEFAVRTGAKQ